MSERFSQRIGESARGTDPNAWAIEDSDEQLLSDLLKASGIDVTKGPIDVVIGGAHMPKLGKAVLESLSEVERDRLSPPNIRPAWLDEPLDDFKPII